MGALRSSPPPTPLVPLRPRLGAGYVLFGLVLVFFALVGVPIGMCGVSSCYFGPGVVVSIMASLLGIGAILVVIGAFLLITTGGPARRPAMMRCPACGAVNPYSSGYCENCRQLLHPQT